ncbi:hypothetical protein DUNSADRAFT_9472 [Dunaliella salina]|uniref:SURP motif domain-containing protein n=1 Tax=Dunaliella salina TaxID=3046 RepID=A0ABQ7GHE5_DUNSA|nr:hypothetical protein DUNSADRAFT_9472 [Dunaliella salina]|eukprot:KAF5834033.1 hypothetical protein DUNSADRAFT_9472 [Dunaliella salina]
MAQTAIQAFFPPHEPPPTPAHPPTDPAQNERISLLLKHCIQNGPAFLATVKERQAQDPNFSFLFPHGPEHAYWRWALYCALMGLPPAQAPVHAMHPPPASMPAPAPASIPPPVPPSSMQLSPETESGFAQVLEALSGSKDSVKAAQQWFMACGPASAGGLARMMAVRCVNGVQILARLNKILNFWTERGVFESSAVEGMRADMTGAADPAVVLAQRLAQVAAAAAAAKAAAAAAAAAPARSASLPPPAAVAPAAPPMMQPPPTSMAAPWGLMQPPPQPVPQAAAPGMPPTAAPAPPVSSAGAAPAMAWPPQPPLQRVSKFHSEPVPPPHVLQATVAAAAAAQQQQKQQLHISWARSWHRMRLRKEYEEDPEGLKQRWWRGGGKRVTGGREPGRLHADGTFTGRAEQHAGLGAHVASAKVRERHPEEAASAAAAAGEGKNKIDDMYNQYRHHRSGSYHQMIFANSAKAKMLGQPPPNIMKGDLPFVPPT